MDSEQAIWFYLVGEAKQGPFTQAQIQGKLGSGGIDKTTYVWNGTDVNSWTELCKVSAFASVARGAPAGPSSFGASAYDENPFSSAQKGEPEIMVADTGAPPPAETADANHPDRNPKGCCVKLLTKCPVRLSWVGCCLGPGICAVALMSILNPLLIEKFVSLCYIVGFGAIVFCVEFPIRNIGLPFKCGGFRPCHCQAYHACLSTWLLFVVRYWGRGFFYILLSMMCFLDWANALILGLLGVALMILGILYLVCGWMAHSKWTSCQRNILGNTIFETDRIGDNNKPAWDQKVLVAFRKFRDDETVGSEKYPEGFLKKDAITDLGVDSGRIITQLEIEAIFNFLDRDGKGRVTFEDFRAGMLPVKISL